MTSPFSRFTDRMIAAEDEPSRRELLAEIGRWRAGHLTDVTALRDAAFAMARLHMLLGQRNQALHEGQSLVSLCQTPPEVSQEDWEAATAFLATLGGTPPKKRLGAQPPRDRSRRKSKGSDGRSEDAKVADWIQAAVAGKPEELRARLKGRKSPRARLVRTWLSLHSALADDNADRRERRLSELERSLRAHLLGDKTGGQREAKQPREAKESSPPAPEEIPETDRELAGLLGTRVPRRRESRIRAFERFASEHPDQLDALVSAALTHHVAVAGLKAPAPWLAGLVTQTMALGPAEATKRVIADLTQQEAYAVTAYRESPFEVMVSLVRDARQANWTIESVRRGILPRTEPIDRKIWTARMAQADGERMVAVAPASEEPYADGLPPQLAERLLGLSASTVLVAPGAGNAGLRDAATSAGATVVETVEGDAVLAAMAALAGTERRADKSAKKSARAETAQGKDAAPKTPRVDPRDALREVLFAEEVPSLEQVVASVAQLRRVRDGFGVFRRKVEEGGVTQVGQRAVLLLLAAHRTAPEHAGLLEGTTLAVNLAVAGEDQGVARSVLLEGETAERFGGPGMEQVLQIVSAIQGGSWTLFRILRGLTRRERRENELLDGLADHLGGFWRLLVNSGEVKGEVWFLQQLSPEGQAAIPHLLQDPRARIVVVPVDQDVMGWYGALDGPQAIGWTGAEGADVVAGLESWRSPAAASDE